MFNLKQTAVTVLVFTSSITFAGTMGPLCAPGNVTVPCERTAWDIGLQALYLKPSYNASLGYIGTLTNAQNTYVTYIENDPDWGWGFKLEGSYHFNTGNDLNLNWYHLGGKTTTVRSVGTFSIPASLIQAVDVPRDAFQIEPRWDAVNLEFGQHVDFGVFKNIRFHGGVQYARIKTNFTNTGFITVLISGVPFTGQAIASSELQYTGFGPRTGADMSYDLGKGLALYANAATAILAGTTKSNTLITNNVPDFLNSFSATAKRNAIVPELEAKLGLNYTCVITQGNLTLDVGYMWINYFNAQQVTEFGTASDTSFGLHGPYAGLKWIS